MAGNLTEKGFWRWRRQRDGWHKLASHHSWLRRKLTSRCVMSLKLSQEFDYGMQSMGAQFDYQNQFANAQYDRDVGMLNATGTPGSLKSSSIRSARPSDTDQQRHPRPSKHWARDSKIGKTSRHKVKSMSARSTLKEHRIGKTSQPSKRNKVSESRAISKPRVKLINRTSRPKVRLTSVKSTPKVNKTG